MCSREEAKEEEKGKGSIFGEALGEVEDGFEGRRGVEETTVVFGFLFLDG